MLSFHKLPFFFRSLRTLYLAVIRETFIGLRLNLHQYLVQLFIVLVAGVAFRAMRGVPGIAGALLSGFVFSCFLSVYLSSVSAAVRQESISFRETFLLAWDLLPSVLRVLFVFFFCTMLVYSVTMSTFIRVFVSLCIAINWNVALEASYQEEDFSWQDFGRLWSFVKNNATEWFLPLIAAAIFLIFIEHGRYAEKIFVLLFATHPVQFVQILASLGGSVESFQEHCWQSIVFFFVLYPSFIFRGVLYKILCRSNRRKRIFEAQLS